MRYEFTYLCENGVEEVVTGDAPTVEQVRETIEKLGPRHTWGRYLVIEAGRIVERGDRNAEGVVIPEVRPQ